ncbi:MAG: hypothetical protein ING71_17315 [Rhodocyclaceae bacterium]|nr:hypothetical protein [Rhodocyclaceae bacterium]
MAIREGQTATNPNTGHTVVFRGGQWVSAGYQNGKGGLSPDPTDTKGVQASAEQRGRVNITLDPALEAHRAMVRLENQKGNVFNREWGARLAEAVPFDSGSVARTIGGQDYQDYESASRAFESAMLPILSGAAVTDSEAKRMVRAVQPQLGDTPQTLRDKARRREQMLNGAVAAVGGSAPFPNSRASRKPAGAEGPLAGISPLRPKGGPVYNPRTQAPSQPRNIARPKNDAEFNRIPVGAQYIDPDDGKVYTKVR